MAQTPNRSNSCSRKRIRRRLKVRNGVYVAGQGRGPVRLMSSQKRVDFIYAVLADVGEPCYYASFFLLLSFGQLPDNNAHLNPGHEARCRRQQRTF